MPSGYHTHPPDLSLGRHVQCEQCGRWHPAETVLIALGSERCEPCRAALQSGPSRPIDGADLTAPLLPLTAA